MSPKIQCNFKKEFKNCIIVASLYKIHFQSGAKINISDGSCPERIVTVTGNTDAIYKAFTLICNKFEEVSYGIVIFQSINCRRRSHPFQNSISFIGFVQCTYCSFNISQKFTRFSPLFFVSCLSSL